MKKTFNTQDQVFWYLQRPNTQPLRQNISADVVVVGGGMAGLTAAQAFANKGKHVVLLEAYYCGAGASGKSSGFITPNCELGLADFIEQYGPETGHRIWQGIQSGVEHIRSNIVHYNIECKYQPLETLMLASSAGGLKGLLKEHQTLVQCGYASEYIPKTAMPHLIGSPAYHGGITYADSFGIDAYAYCQAMKKILTEQGVMIFEETPAISIQAHEVTTLHATVKAEHVIVCTDQFTPMLGRLKKEIYHAQTFLLASQPLTEQEIRTIFPSKNLMCWDTELIYNYFRLMGDRLLLGGGSLFSTYNRQETHHSAYMYKKLTNYWQKKFPQLPIQFEQMWPGLIGISKDIAPLAGHDKDEPSIYYIAAAAGLPIAAMLGNYCADQIVDGQDHFNVCFSPYRSFPVNNTLQTVLGKKLSFALSNFIKLKVP